MLKYRRLSKIPDIYSKTQPDELLSTNDGQYRAQNAQQSLYEISLKAEEQDYSSTFHCWPKQYRNNCTADFSTTFAVQQGCFSKNLCNLNTNTIALDKRNILQKKKLFQRQNQFKTTLKTFQNQSRKKKSCTSINFVLPTSKGSSNRGHSRIHSSINMPKPNTNSQINTEPCKQQKTALICDMNELDNKSQKKKQYPKLFSQRYTNRLQTEMTARKKKVVHSYQNIKVQNETSQEQSFRSTSYSKYFSILNTLIHQEKKRVIYHIKVDSPSFKLKGAIRKRLSICS